jgi:paraquat-inducible protein B
VRAEEFYQELNLNLQKLFDEMNSMLTEEERTREISRATFSGMMPLYIQHTKAYTESLKETMKSPELTLGAKATLQTNAQGLDRVVAHLEAIGKVVELMEKIFHSLQYSPPYHTPPSYAATNRNLIG